MTSDSCTVIKIGGSILRDAESYRRVADLAAQRFRREPTWIVVSAAQGITDALERLAHATDPDPRLLLKQQTRATGVPPDHSLAAELRRGLREAQSGWTDGLLAWGERASAEALRTRLSRTGVDVPVIELQPGTTFSRRSGGIVPGFYVRDRSGRVRCLPRGGSDISAVLLTAQVGARKVHLWKEGGGIHFDGGVVSFVGAAELLPRLSGTRPLHPAALLLAYCWGIDLVLEDPFGQDTSTHVVSRTDGWHAVESHPSVDFTAHECWWESPSLALRPEEIR